MAFDVNGALKAGYSMTEIADHLAKGAKFNSMSARQAGYSDEEIVNHLLQGKGKQAPARQSVAPADVRAMDAALVAAPEVATPTMDSFVTTREPERTAPAPTGRLSSEMQPEFRVAPQQSIIARGLNAVRRALSPYDTTEAMDPADIAAAQIAMETGKGTDTVVEPSRRIEKAIKPIPGLAASGLQQGEGGLVRAVGEMAPNTRAAYLGPVAGPLSMLVPWDKIAEAGKSYAESGVTEEKRLREKYPAEPGTLTSMVQSAGQSFGMQLIPMLASIVTANPAPALAAMSGITAGQSYHDYRKRGHSPEASAIAATGQGIIEGVTELLPVTKLLNIAGGKQALVKSLIELYGSEVPGEMIATVTQDMIDKSMIRPNMTVGEMGEEIKKYFTSGEAALAQKETVGSTLIQTTATAGLGVGARTLTRAAANLNRIDPITGGLTITSPAASGMPLLTQEQAARRDKLSNIMQGETEEAAQARLQAIEARKQGAGQGLTVATAPTTPQTKAPQEPVTTATQEAESAASTIVDEALADPEASRKALADLEARHAKLKSKIFDEEGNQREGVSQKVLDNYNALTATIESQRAKLAPEVTAGEEAGNGQEEVRREGRGQEVAESYAIKEGDVFDSPRGRVTVTDVSDKASITFRTEAGATFTRGRKALDGFVPATASGETKGATSDSQQGETTEVAKQPWEMTREEFRGNPDFWKHAAGAYINGDGVSGPHRTMAKNWLKTATMGSDGVMRGSVYEGRVPEPFPLAVDGKLHDSIIKRALAEGKPVPPEVLAEYPDLQKPGAHFPTQADVHAEELSKNLEENGIPQEHPAHQAAVEERRKRERVPDEQTGLISREHHKPTLDRAWKEHQESKRDFAYADVDVANLGGLNVHAGGNEQANVHLREMAQIIDREVKASHPQAQVFRKGGDEFGIIAPDASESELEAAMEKAKAAVSAYAKEQGLDQVPHSKAGNPPGVGIEYGVTEYKGKKGVSHVLNVADARTNQAKIARKEGAVDVVRGETEETRAVAPEGQTGGIEKGTGEDRGTPKAEGGKERRRVKRKSTKTHLLPEGWKMEVGKTRTKEGHTYESEVDWQRKRLVFSEQKHMDNPEIVNHEIAHVVIETLPETKRDALFDEYVKAAGLDEWTVKNNFHHEKIAMDYGDYLTNPDPTPKELKAVFDKHLGEGAPEKKKETVSPETRRKNLEKRLAIAKNTRERESIRAKLEKLKERTAEKDPNIGREWNAPYGRQRIVAKDTDGPTPLYDVQTVETGAIRKYSADKIEDVIKRNEHELTPEYEAEQKERAEIVRLREEREARQAEKDKRVADEIAAFTAGMSNMAAGRARDALLKQISFDGVVLTRKEYIEKRIAEGRTVTGEGEERRLEDADGAGLGVKALTKTGMDYAEFLLKKKEKSPEVDTYKQEQDARAAEAEEYARLQKLGREKVPGVRLEAAADAGRMWDMKEKGDISEKEWNDYVAAITESGKVAQPEKPASTVDDEINDLSMDDVAAMFDDAAEEAEEAKAEQFMREQGGVKGKTPEAEAGPAPSSRFSYRSDPAEILINPTRSELVNMIRGSRFKELRVVKDPATGDIYVADAGSTYHKFIAQQAGLDWSKIDGKPEYMFTVGQGDFARAINPSNTRYSIAVQSAGIGKTDIEQSIRPLLAKWKNAPKVTVVQSESELPADVVDEIASYNAQGEIDGVFANDGSIYLIADNTASAEGAVTVLLHEAVGHYGVRGLLGKKFNPLLLDVYYLYGKKGLQKIADRYGLDLDNLEDRFIAAEEKLAELAESGEKPGLIRRAIALIREWLRSIGVNISLSDNDVKAMISRAAGWVERGSDGRGTETVGGKGQGVYSEAYKGGDQTRAADERYSYSAEAASRYPRSGNDYIAPEAIDGTQGKDLSHRITDRGRVEEIATSFARAVGSEVAPRDMALWLRMELDDLGRLAGVFQKQVIMFQGKREDVSSLPGFYDPKRPDTIFINVVTPNPHLTIFGHELTHALKNQRPDLYKKFVSVAKESKTALLNNKAFLEERDGREVTDEENLEEFSADYIGAKLTEKGFWEKLHAKSPQLFRAALDAVKRIIRKIQGIQFKTDHMFKDAKKAEAAALDVLNRYAKEGAGSNAEARFSRRNRTGDPDTDAVLDKIGRPDKALKERLAGILGDKIKLRLEQGIFDQFASLKALDKMAGVDSPDDSAYITARMTTGFADTFTAILNHGAPIWASGWVKVATRDNGILKIFEPVANDLDLFLGWMVGERAQKLMNEGRERYFTQEEIDKLKALRTPENAVRWERVRINYVRYKKQVLDFAEQGGIINPEARRMWDHEEYVPFYRIAEDAEKPQGPTGKRGIASQNSGIRTLKGGTDQLGDIFENILRNFSHLTQAAIKNRAAEIALEKAEELGLASKARWDWKAARIETEQIVKKIREQLGDDDILEPEADQLDDFMTLFHLMRPKGTSIVHVLKEGKPQYYEVHDELLLKSLTNLNAQVFQGAIMDLMRFTKRLLTIGVTSMPDFMIRNFVRDTLHTWVINRGDFTPGISSLKGAVKTFREDDDMVQLMAAGGSFHGGFAYGHDMQKTSKHVKKLLHKKGVAANILDTPAKLWDFWKKIGASGENAARVSIYQNTLRKSGSSLQAAFEAKDVMDFSMRGDFAIVKFLCETVPFLGARIQGLQRLGKSAIESPGSFMLKGGAIAMASVLLYLINRDDDRYKELEEWDKDTYFHFWVGKEHFRLPKPFEVGVIFGTIPERLTELLIEKQHDGKLFASRLLQSVTQTFAIGLPQLISEPVQQWANRDSFTGRQIVGQRIEGLKPEDQKEPWTGATAVEVGNILGVSPRRIEHAVEGYFGTLGTYILGASDIVMRRMLDYPAQPTTKLEEWPVVKSFYRGDEPPKNTKYLTEFYDLLKEVDETYNSIQEARKMGDRDRVRELRDENLELLRTRTLMEGSRDQLSAINRRTRRILYDKDMTGDEKREELDELAARKNSVAKRAIERVESKGIQIPH